MRRVDFFVRCIPPKATAQHKGAVHIPATNRVRIFKTKRVKDSEQCFAALLRPHVPAEPFGSAVRLEVSFVWPFRVSERKGIRDRLLVPMHTHPDFDNISKTFCDVMTSLFFWADDSLVADGRIRKFWGVQPGIHVRIDEIDATNAFEGIEDGTLALLGVSGLVDVPEEGDLFGGGQ